MYEILERLNKIEKMVKNELAIINAEITQLKLTKKFAIADQIIKKYSLKPFNVSVYSGSIQILCRMSENSDNLNDLIPDFEDGNMVYRLGDADITLMS